MIQRYFRRNFNSAPSLLYVTATRISEKLANLCQDENCRPSSFFFSSPTWLFLRSLAQATDHIDLVVHSKHPQAKIQEHVIIHLLTGPSKHDLSHPQCCLSSQLSITSCRAYFPDLLFCLR